MIEPSFPAPPVTATDAVEPGPSRTTPGRPRRSAATLVIAASLLSAALASGTTAALVGSRQAATVTIAATTPVAATAATTSGAASVASIAAASGPAVVTIKTTVQATGRFGRQLSGTGVGSGFVFDAAGWIMTAAHVVEGAGSVEVTFTDGRTMAATVAASDPALDLAILKVDATGLASLALGSSDALAVGQTVLAIGDPLGDYPGSVTVGIVSGLDRTVTVADETTGGERTLDGLVQTDAAINQGNSGGPLVAGNGTVVGVVTAASSSAQGLGFAVPIDRAAGLITRAKGG